MLSIGEFSRVTRLSVKALRLYHQKGILVPDAVRLESRYRYYSSASVERAGVVTALKGMGFTLDEIRAILAECRDDREIVAAVRTKLAQVERSLAEQRRTKDTLETFLRRAEAGPDEPAPASEVSLEDVPEILACGIRFKGRYGEVGPYFGRLARACGRHVQGKPFCLYYDGEFKDDAADIEACLEVRTRAAVPGGDCRRLPGGRAVTVVHRGPYETLSRTYQKLFEFCRERRLVQRLPTREVYLKGPGMIFRGNPRRYETKLIVLVEVPPAARRRTGAAKRSS